AGKRKTNYMFLYGPDEPPFLGAKDPCEPSNPKKRCCSLVDLQVYVAVQATVLLPVQLIAIPPIVGPTITHTNPVHVKPTWNFPAPLPTVLNALSYANGTCQNCQKDNWHTLTESPRTRWAAATIHAYLGVLAVPSNPGFMLGVLINDEERLICVAYSSNSSSDNAHANLNGCKFTGYKLKLYGNEGFADIDTCRGGKDIRKHRN